jgi:hypothetical protein
MSEEPNQKVSDEWQHWACIPLASHILGRIKIIFLLKKMTLSLCQRLDEAQFHPNQQSRTNRQLYRTFLCRTGIPTSTTISWQSGWSIIRASISHEWRNVSPSRNPSRTPYPTRTSISIHMTKCYSQGDRTGDFELWTDAKGGSGCFCLTNTLNNSLAVSFPVKGPLVQGTVIMLAILDTRRAKYRRCEPCCERDETTHFGAKGMNWR